jgi:Transposase IS4
MLCFLWQDNNAVLGIATAHRLKNETVERLRKRPSPTSTNARILRPVFGNLPAKRLRILCTIDDYNHFMNGVDTANQLRHNFTAHRSFESRVWRQLWYSILDVCTVNGYLLWKGDKEDPRKRGQRPYRNALIDALLNIPYEVVPIPQQPLQQPPRQVPQQVPHSAGNNVNATQLPHGYVDVVASELGYVDVAQPSTQPSTMTGGDG